MPRSSKRDRNLPLDEVLARRDARSLEREFAAEEAQARAEMDAEYRRGMNDPELKRMVAEYQAMGPPRYVSFTDEEWFRFPRGFRGLIRQAFNHGATPRSDRGLRTLMLFEPDYSNLMEMLADPRLYETKWVRVPDDTRAIP